MFAPARARLFRKRGDAERQAASISLRVTRNFFGGSVAPSSLRAYSEIASSPRARTSRRILRTTSSGVSGSPKISSVLRRLLSETMPPPSPSFDESSRSAVERSVSSARRIFMADQPQW